jgi:hypothetical protein
MDNGNEVLRKKSSKRKADDYAREKEIQAMSSPIPIPKPKRPATYSGSGPLARDTKSVPGDLNRRLARPASQISLPRQEDLESQSSAQNSFKVGALAALSPRPTLKYDHNPRSFSGKQPLRQAPAEPPIQEEDLAHSRKRINELADDLDSNGIRELMERDRRRKEKKKETDRAKLQRKLQRRADRQREEETRRARAAEFASQSSAQLAADAEQGITHDGPGPSMVEDIPATSAPGADHKPASSSPTQDPFTDPVNVEARRPTDIRNPFEDEHDLDVMHEPSDDEQETGPPIPVKSPLRKAETAKSDALMPSQGALSPPMSPPQAPSGDRTQSQTSGLARNITPEIAESIERDRRSSDQSGQQMSSWTSFFRRGGRRKPSITDRGRATPSEFSNTSRESFAVRKQPPPMVPPGRTFRRSDSATPQRTMSKFREDLPELPLSPPDSRVQSPEVAASSLSSKQVRQSMSGTLDGKSLATSSSNPTLDRRPDSRLQTGRTIETDVTTPEAPSHVLSQSLASVDSEGSWLSGKPVKRSSGLTNLSVRHSGASMTPQPPGAFEPEEDAEEIAEDEYYNRLSPAPDDRRQSAVTEDRRASSTIIDLSKESGQSPAPEVPPLPVGDEEIWHQGVARQPTVVRQARQAKSKEGLLKQFEDGEAESSGDEVESPQVEEVVQLMRARSVDYKGHARHVSAGSARLLDIRRSSVVSTDTPPRSPALPKAVEATNQKSASMPKL